MGQRGAVTEQEPGCCRHGRSQSPKCQLAMTGSISNQLMVMCLFQKELCHAMPLCQLRFPKKGLDREMSA